MPKPYSQDLRDRVIDAVERGKMSRIAQTSAATANDGEPMCRYAVWGFMPPEAWPFAWFDDSRRTRAPRSRAASSPRSRARERPWR